MRCKLTESRNTPYSGTTQLELVPIAARDVPVPLAENGYRAFIVDSTVLADAGGPVAYVTDAMAERATARDYRRAEFLWRQGNLFDRLPDEEPEV